MSSQQPTHAEATEQKNFILDALWRVRESARIWRDLIADPASRTALEHIQHAADVLIDRCDLLSIPPRPSEPSPPLFLDDLLP